jgi:hypothetical protein
MADCLVEASACARKISAAACQTISIQIGFAVSFNQVVKAFPYSILWHLSKPYCVPLYALFRGALAGVLGALRAVGKA